MYTVQPKSNYSMVFFDMVINDLQKASECQVIMAFMIVGKIRNAVRCNVIT